MNVLSIKVPINILYIIYNNFIKDYKIYINIEKIIKILFENNFQNVRFRELLKPSCNPVVIL